MRVSIANIFDVLSDVGWGAPVTIGLIALAIFGGYQATQTNARHDSIAAPYLEAANYHPPSGCPNPWDGVSPLPSACGADHYLILSADVMKKYGLYAPLVVACCIGIELATGPFSWIALLILVLCVRRAPIVLAVCN